MSSANALKFEWSKILLFGKELNYCICPFLPFPKRQILDSSKLKEFADDNFKFNENGRKFAIRVENTVGKGQIARYEQFLLFPHCFQKTNPTDTKKPGLVWERVKVQGTNETMKFVLDRKHCRELGENAGHQHFLDQHFLLF